MLASCSAAALVCSLIVTVAARPEDFLEAFKERILSDLGMERFPDMREVNSSRQHVRRMTREYLRRVSRSQRVTHHPKVCTEDSVIFQPDDIHHLSDVRWSLLRFPNGSSAPVSADMWRWSPVPALVVPCSGRTHCCGAQLQLVERAARSRREAAQPACGRSSCCRRSLKVNFKELGWDWVVQPPEFEAYFCSGRCKGAAQGAEFASSHALVQGILSARGRGVGRPCCAPRKLRPLDLLHYNDKSPPELVVTRQKGMIVKECACT